MAKILILDDRPADRELLGAILSNQGHLLLQAGDGVEALAIVRSEHPDLVLADVMMPTMDGFEFVERLRSDPSISGTPVIFHTATYRVNDVLPRALACGVHCVLAKPAAHQAILDAVNTALGMNGAGQPTQTISPSAQTETLGDTLQSAFPYLHSLEALNLRMSHAIEDGLQALGDQKRFVAATGKLRDVLKTLQDVGLRLTTLNEAGIELASTRDPEEILRILCRAAQNLVSSKYAGVGVLNDAGAGLSQFFARGISEDDLEKIGTPAASSGPMGATLRLGKPQRLSNLSGEPEHVGLPKAHPPVQSLMVVPIASPSRIYGWLYLADRIGPAEFSDVDEEIILTLTCEAALAYENLSLYAELRVLAGELGDAKENYRVIFEGALEGIFQTTLDGRLVFVNPAMARMLGYDAPRHVVSDPGNARHQLYADANRRIELVEIFRTQDSVRDFEFQACRKDGQTIWLSAAVRLVKDGSGSPLRVEGLVEDISVRKGMEDKLRRSEEQYRLLFDNSPNPMWVFDPETLAFLAVNEAAISQYGYSREEFLRMTICDIRPPEEVAGFLEYYASLGNRDAPMGVSGTFKHRTKDGRVLEVEVAASGTVFDGKPARLAIVNDVTEKKTLETQLLQAQKMESIGVLAGGIAHDFSNLLNIVVGYTEMLQERISDRPDWRHYTENVLQAARRAADLSRQLLAFSRRQVLQPEVLNLNPLLENFEKMLRRIIPESIEIRTSLKSRNGLVRADAGQMEQVVLNLAVNARDAMPDGGCLTIETADVELDEHYALQHPTVKPGKYVMLAVSDTGHGMAPEILKRVFEPFYTTKEQGKGTGLGLGVAYGIVKQSGGWIWAYSEPDHGSTFKVYLPCFEGVAEAAVTRSSVRGMPPAGNATILLAEDEEGLSNMMRELLTGLGYKVLVAQHGADALRIAGDYPYAIHLLITDLIMPGIGGRELAERLTLSRPSVQVLYLSGYTDDSAALEGVRTGKMAFLSKPVTATDLAHKVHDLLIAVDGRSVV